MKRIQLIVAYEGTHYFGWQVQSHKKAIQPLIQEALQIALGHPVELTGAGRTDRGVHAKAQVAHFDTEKEVSLPKLLFSLNALLPPDIRVQKLLFVPETFHARYSAKAKIYHYHLYLDPVLDPFARRFSFHVKYRPLDMDKLQQSAALLIGEHDFAGFSNKNSKGCAAHDSVRELKRLDIIQEPKGLRLEFEADGFLYKMVRNITGTLLEIARGKKEIQTIYDVFKSKNRSQAGETAPPQGLFLHAVLY